MTLQRSRYPGRPDHHTPARRPRRDRTVCSSSPVQSEQTGQDGTCTPRQVSCPDCGEALRNWRGGRHRRPALARPPCTTRTPPWTSTPAQQRCDRYYMYSGNTHRGELLNICVRGSERGEADLLRELGKARVRKDGRMAYQLVKEILQCKTIFT